MTKITLFFCLYASVMFSQNISGTIYDAEAPVSGSRIMNITSKSIAASDGNGYFEIYAQVNDTLIFSSLFHHTKQMVITPSHFNETQVFELKKIVNELDEVALNGASTSKAMDGQEATKRMNKQFKTDVERNPHLYRRPNLNSGPLDIIEIGRRVKKLFKSKTPKEQKTIATYITAEDLNTFFKSDKFFNDKFLVLDLNITKDYKHLFFAYCESKDISPSLLRPGNNIYLIDKLLEYSEEFRDILKESQN